MFMWGPAPIRRTIGYLKSGRLAIKDNVKIMEVHYSLHGVKYQTRDEMKQDHFHGLRKFYFWEMPRLQYQNPNLQIVRLLDRMPSPFLRFWLDNGKDIIIDCFDQDHREILNRVLKTVGKSEARLNLEESLSRTNVIQDNPALFGHGRQRFCACEVPGQHPCPGVIRNPSFDQLETLSDGSRP